MRSWGSSISGSAQCRERDLVQIVYVSVAAAALTEMELTEMAARARVRTDAARLTGLLLHRDSYFYAILEGPRRRVLQRIEEIVAGRDERSLRILREEPIATRRFANWSFGRLPDSTIELGGPDAFLQRFCEALA
jgi:hypothetical protein